jgi:hypothetical protein
MIRIPSNRSLTGAFLHKLSNNCNFDWRTRARLRNLAHSRRRREGHPIEWQSHVARTRLLCVWGGNSEAGIVVAGAAAQVSSGGGYFKNSTDG